MQNRLSDFDFDFCDYLKQKHAFSSGYNDLPSGVHGGSVRDSSSVIDTRAPRHDLGSLKIGAWRKKNAIFSV